MIQIMKQKNDEVLSIDVLFLALIKVKDKKLDGIFTKYNLNIENVEVVQNKIKVFKHKDKVPVKQFFALYAITLGRYIAFAAPWIM